MRLLRVMICLSVLVALWSCESAKRPVQATGPAVVAAVPAVAPKQVVVTDANGVTVYYFDLDQPDQSTCVDECGAYWFPVRPQPALNGNNFTVFTRSDGTQQLAYRGRPLYTYHRDKNPGDIKGDGQRGRWHALRY